ncbi:MAG: YHS domain-containing (seleno)protein [Pseudomonadota bacterium]
MRRLLMMLGGIVAGVMCVVGSHKLYANPDLGISPIYTDVETGLAIHGYDPVAYFKLSEGDEAIPGSPDYEYEWNGALWRFASMENLQLFRDNPQYYAPQYGGYCAYAVSRGYTAPIEPNAWAVESGKLYLNYNKPVRILWNLDRTGNIDKANVNWPGLCEGC